MSDWAAAWSEWHRENQLEEGDKDAVRVNEKQEP